MALAPFPSHQIVLYYPIPAITVRKSSTSHTKKRLGTWPFTFYVKQWEFRKNSLLTYDCTTKELVLVYRSGASLVIWGISLSFINAFCNIYILKDMRFLVCLSVQPRVHLGSVKNKCVINVSEMKWNRHTQSKQDQTQSCGLSSLEI